MFVIAKTISPKEPPAYEGSRQARVAHTVARSPHPPPPLWAYSWREKIIQATMRLNLQSNNYALRTAPCDYLNNDIRNLSTPHCNNSTTLQSRTPRRSDSNICRIPSASIHQFGLAGRRAQFRASLYNVFKLNYSLMSPIFRSKSVAGWRYFWYNCYLRHTGNPFLCTRLIDCFLLETYMVMIQVLQHTADNRFSLRSQPCRLQKS